MGPNLLAVAPIAPAGAPSQPMFSVNDVAHILAQFHTNAPRTLEMPAHGYSSAPKFDDNPANLKSYFSELEYHFDICNITDATDQKIPACRYLDATQQQVWHITDGFENAMVTWEQFKWQIYMLYLGSGCSMQRINLAVIVAFIYTNAATTYSNKKELGAYYR